MTKLSGIELKRARLVPSSVFACPDAVLSCADLSRAQKIAILRRWEFDVRQRAAEGTAQAAHPAILDRIRGALATLEPALSPNRRAATAVRH